MRSNRFDALERFTPLFEPPERSFEGFLRRRDRKRRNQRVAAAVVAIAVFAVPVWIVATGGPTDRTRTPASTGTGSWVHVPEAPAVDYVIDLNTSAVTPLPDPIIRSLGEAGPDDEHRFYRYAASSDGSRLAYVGTGEEGTPQIFIAGLGPGVRQMTHDPTGATSPAWSPDGRSVAYVGFGGGDVQNLFVLEIATGETRQITDGTRDVWGPSFTPDGSSLVYTDPGSASDEAEMRTVPIIGGRSTILFGGGHGGMGHAGSGSISPDGTLATMTGHEVDGPGAALFVSNADGTQRRAFPAYGTNPAGTWSPDGSHIVGLSYRGGFILVIDVATGVTTRVAEGTEAIWLDDHTLLVEV